MALRLSYPGTLSTQVRQASTLLTASNLRISRGTGIEYHSARPSGDAKRLPNTTRCEVALSNCSLHMDVARVHDRSGRKGLIADHSAQQHVVSMLFTDPWNQVRVSFSTSSVSMTSVGAPVSGLDGMSSRVQFRPGPLFCPTNPRNAPHTRISSPSTFPQNPLLRA